MNIFFLDRHPKTAAAFHCDKHAVKMPIEYAQILSTALHLTGGPTNDSMYKVTHEHHPCVKWAMKSRDHWEWLWLLGHHLGNEYSKRYNRIHKSTRILRCLPVPNKIKCVGWEDPPQAMPDEYKNKDVVTAYRTFYLKDKVRFAKWAHSNEPSWWRGRTE